MSMSACLRYLASGRICGGLTGLLSASLALLLALLPLGPAAAVGKVNVGDNAWNLAKIALPDLQGRQRTLEEWRGKVILVNFWASWCGPCQYEIPDFVGFQREYRDAGLQIVGVGIDDARKLGNVRRSLGINYPVLVAGMNGNSILADWGDYRGVVPYSVVLDRDGTIVLIRSGRLDKRSFDRHVLPLLQKPAVLAGQ